MSNIQVYTRDQRDKIKAQIMVEVEKSFEVNRFGKGTPIWMCILFILKKFNRGSYYGTLELKVLGTSCNDVKEKEVTHKLQEMFEDP